MKVYTLIDGDGFPISNCLVWDEVIALVDYLELDDWDVIEFDVEDERSLVDG